MARARVRIAVALISAATIALELALMRALALRFWHHFAALIISTALLGFGASGTLLTVLRPVLRRRIAGTICAAALLLTVAIPAAVRTADLVELNVQFLTWDASQVGRLVLLELVFFVPLLLAGLAVGVALMDAPARVSGHYAASLIGSGLGAVAAIVLMQHLPLPQVVTTLAGGSLLAAAAVTPWRRIAGPVGLALAAAGWLAMEWLGPWQPRVSQYKALADALRRPQVKVLARAEGPLGRVDVVAAPSIHLLPPGLSLACPETIPPAAMMTVDGDQADAIYRTGGRGSDFRFLDWTTAALPYRLVDRPRVLLLGAGGGGGIGLARLHESRRIAAVEMNPQVISLMRGPLRERGGRVYEGPEVEVLNEDPRGYLARCPEAFDVIELPFVGGSSAGAGAGRESYLLTVEALGRMLSLLRPGGMISVTCAARVPPREELRLLDIARRAILARGEGRDTGVSPVASQSTAETAVSRPRQHLAVVRNYDAVTLLVFRDPIGRPRAEAVVDWCRRRNFDVDLLPHVDVTALEKFHEFGRAGAAIGPEAVLGPGREALLDDYVFDVGATTDDRPYFHHFFRYRGARVMFKRAGNVARAYLEVGYVLLLAALAQSLPVALALILGPLAGLARSLGAPAGKARSLAYFLLIGTGFMFVEMMFIQRLTVYLADPIYAAAVVLGALLVFAGLGSRLSQAWPSPPRTVIRGAGLTVAALALAYVFGMGPLLSATGGWPLTGRAALAAALLAPLAAAMGHMLPTAMRTLGAAAPALVPWCWAVNGFASVVAAVGATLLAMDVGFTAVAVAGAAAYVLAAVVWRRPKEASAGTDEPTRQSPV